MSLADYKAAMTLRDESFASLIIAAAARCHADDFDRIERAFWNDLFDPEAVDPDDFDHREAASMPDATVGALLMAAYLKADHINVLRIGGAFPLLVQEASDRENAPGGRLPGDPQAVAQ
ncbi:hypothetical protein [Frankia sp. AgW1.1]|uniref:hypothetical protein n=1 Tax=Frankia sp. AgW1.1 TaxID=1836971 RepID=UPI00193308CC|nr:hypothetical protein [Frankia sp. AgW1.1]MBL7487032.1 hypothetical protein [Frankia sp. AgW1.1]